MPKTQDQVEEVQVEQVSTKTKRTRNSKPSMFMVGHQGKDGLWTLTKMEGAKSAADVKAMMKKGTASEYPDGKYVILLRKEAFTIQTETRTARYLN